MTAFRNLPSVERLVRAVEEQIGAEALPRTRLVEAARAELDAVRAVLREQRDGQQNDVNVVTEPENAYQAFERLVAAVRRRLHTLTTPSLRPVINASGVIIQTNLGRAPLSDAALAAMQAIGTGYSNLEYDLDAGQRGSRSVHLTALLSQITGAESALVVNNNAAAIYLALIALATGREVIISRGQAVEIGGGFRIPDVLRQSGATLVEVGTTNRTYARDYAAAINDRTALLMRVHTSNFRLTGFVHETSLAEIVAVGRRHGVPVLDDLGSGTLLPTALYGLSPEPTVQESLVAGADLVTFSGDKLLGGSQAGLIVGRKDLTDQLKGHPLARALRVDKNTLSAMEATLMAYARGTAPDEIPVWRMISMPLERLRPRVEAVANQLQAAAIPAHVVECASAVGGGSVPGDTLPSLGVALNASDLAPLTLDDIARALRTGEPAVVPRIAAEQLIFDLRTVSPQHDSTLFERICNVVKHQTTP